MRFSSAALLLIALTPVVSNAQEIKNSGPSRAVILSAAKEVMQKAHFCGLITLDANGGPQARVVDPFAPEDDMTVWIATSGVTRKVAQIEKDPRVTLLCTPPDGSGYVTLIGKAELVRDAAEKAKHWKPEWKQFYKDENRGEDYVLIRIRTTRLEIMSAPHNLMNDPQTWRPVILEF
jgi:general stress protein 26